MGGRMSGESPRERNCVDRNCGISVADPSQFSTFGIDVAAPATVPTQASRQQPIECCPLGQQESWDAEECETAAVWQSVDIICEIPANATTELCSPMASITTSAMS